MRVIVTGATGMVGEGVLHECLLDPVIEKVLVVGRRPCGVTHVKLQEAIVPDFFHLDTIETTVQGYDACFFCLGVSSVGKKEAEFYHLTYELTMNFARLLASRNRGMVFCYVSGAGTNPGGKLMWARVKGKTENDLKTLGFRHVYNFRPGIMTPTKGLKNTLKAYKYLGWLMPVFRILIPGRISTLSAVGRAMIHVVTHGYPSSTIEVNDIHQLSAVLQTL